ncbi:MAG: 1-deoxy-D-xylulose-5-phosphate reductoisomerase [Rubrimonas sp.]|uniref:1-deoxy-D-xylulose-5-phosphate reductoisomerase n=1 Tax=Rubrimonas sp. TaxID=2036015 RepID=UPI002FDDC1F2
MRSVTVLGSTGSIGVSTLDVLERLGGREAFAVEALTGARNVDLLAEQARRLGARLAVTADPARYADLKAALAGSGVEAAAGADAVREAAARPADWVMAAIVGAAGLAPTLEAARRGATVALANKECLVSAGALFLREIAAGGATLIPVDSEHSAIFQVLERTAKPERIILTASGGPFRDWPLERMEAATPREAVAHPNWSMGAKISVDSASMFNKALEMIEARWLFDAAPHQIEVIVHPQSIVHSMVGYADGAVLAQLGPPDMRGAIAYALSWPDRAALPLQRLDFAALGALEFRAPDEVRFPALRIAREALVAGGSAGCVLNGAKEVALESFLAGEIGFLDMARIVEGAMERLSPYNEAATLEAVLELDAQARRAAKAICAAAA